GLTIVFFLSTYSGASASSFIQFLGYKPNKNSSIWMGFLVFGKENGSMMQAVVFKLGGMFMDILGCPRFVNSILH
ncbi:hypothetical protein AALD01_18065, partial [Oscillospiraceae bacterium 21-37]